MLHLQFEINRGPVLVLWVAVVANEAGHKWSEALSFGRSIANTFAQSKGQRLGILEEQQANAGPYRGPQGSNTSSIELFGRSVVVAKTTEGLRALSEGRPIDPMPVLNQMRKAFGSALGKIVQVGRPALARNLAMHCQGLHDHVFYTLFLSRLCQAMQLLARSCPNPTALQHEAYRLYTEFWPEVPEGTAGWGAKGILDLNKMARMTLKQLQPQ